MSDPTLALACSECSWSPLAWPAEPLIEEHAQTEHPGVEAKAEIKAFCPRDDTPLPDPFIRRLPNGKRFLDHTCPKCRRTYTVFQSGASR